MITNRLRERSVTIGAGVLAPIVGRDQQGNGGLEGVLNGARAATCTIVSEINDTTVVQVAVRAVRGATPMLRTPAAPLVIPATDTLLLEFGPEDLAGYDLAIYAENATGGVLRVAWEAVR